MVVATYKSLGGWSSGDPSTDPTPIGEFFRRLDSGRPLQPSRSFKGHGPSPLRASQTLDEESIAEYNVPKVKGCKLGKVSLAHIPQSINAIV